MVVIASGMDSMKINHRTLIKTLTFSFQIRCLIFLMSDHKNIIPLEFNLKKRQVLVY